MNVPAAVSKTLVVLVIVTSTVMPFTAAQGAGHVEDCLIEFVEPLVPGGVGAIDADIPCSVDRCAGR